MHKQIGGELTAAVLVGRADPVAVIAIGPVRRVGRGSRRSAKPGRLCRKLLVSISAVSVLPPPAIAPITATAEEQKEDDDNKNEVHDFLQPMWRGNFPCSQVGMAEFVHDPRNLRSRCVRRGAARRSPQ